MVLTIELDQGPNEKKPKMLNSYAIKRDFNLSIVMKDIQKKLGIEEDMYPYYVLQDAKEKIFYSETQDIRNPFFLTCSSNESFQAYPKKCVE
jgi:hypothetical protein